MLGNVNEMKIVLPFVKAISCESSDARREIIVVSKRLKQTVPKSSPQSIDWETKYMKYLIYVYQVSDVYVAQSLFMKEKKICKHNEKSYRHRAKS
jgi:hypothetical protein